MKRGIQSSSRVRKKLAGSDRRSIGRSTEVVEDIIAGTEPFAALIEGMLDPDPVLRMRCADAAEKVTIRHPEYLIPHAKKLLHEIAAVRQKEVRWHVAQMIPRLPLTPAQRTRSVEILMEYLRDDSRIVKTLAMQALADLAVQDSSLLAHVLRTLSRLTRTGSPAMQARGRKLVSRLQRIGAAGRTPPIAQKA